MSIINEFLERPQLRLSMQKYVENSLFSEFQEYMVKCNLELQERRIKEQFLDELRNIKVRLTYKKGTYIMTDHIINRAQKFLDEYLQDVEGNTELASEIYSHYFFHCRLDSEILGKIKFYQFMRNRLYTIDYNTGNILRVRNVRLIIK